MTAEERIADLERQLADARAEAASGRFFRKLVEACPQILSVLRADGEAVFVSAASEEVAGMPPATLVGATSFDLVHPDDRAKIETLWSEVLASPPGRVTRTELRRRHRDGRWIHMESSVRNLLADEDVRGILVSGHEVTESVRARELLHETQARYELAMQASREGIVELDLVTGRVDLSPSILANLGYGPGELSGTAENLARLVHAEDRARAEAARTAHLETKAPFDVEVRVLCKDGSYRWLRLAGETVEDGRGRPARIIGQARDIHDRKVAEIALHDSERMFRALFEETSLAVTVRDMDSQKFIDCNSAALRLYGFKTREELFGTTPDALATRVQPDGRDSVEVLRRYVEGAMRDGVARMEWTARRKNGETFPAEVRTTVIQLEDRRRIMQTFIEDVTERRRNEDTLRRRALHDELMSEVSRRFLNDDPEAATGATLERLAVRFGAARVSLFALEDRGQRLRCTHRWSARGLDMDPEEYPAPAADTEGWLEQLARGSGPRVLHAAVGYAGRVFGLLTVLAPEGRGWTTDEGATLRMIGELIAVGRVRRAAEIALAKATEDAVAASLTKSAFLANMSHELRTPLNGVIGMVDLLATTRLDERQRRYTEMARVSANLLLSVISDILDFSKIEAGKLEIEATPLVVSEIVEEVASILALSAEEKGLELTCASASALATPLVGDPARLRQVLVNLVSNAIKFTRRGEVSVRALAVAQAVPSVAEVRVRIEVRDTGVGIPREAQAKLFQPFTQLDASTTREHGGTGLGLAICRELVDRMGGTIGFTSAPGAGSTFWFELPLARPREDAVAEDTRDGRLAGLRVLGVDDSATNRDLLHAQLTAAGMLCDTAPGGVEALHMLVEAAVTRPYALAVLDHHMPGMDGHELAARITRDPRLRETRLVMLGSVAQPVDPEAQRASGIVGYCTKPVWRKQLLRVLRAALDGAVHDEDRPSPPAPGALAGAGRRILLVEDSPINAELAGEILRSEGYEFDLAEDGLSAVRATRARAYDLVLMDCQLPGVDGFEATQRIRALERSGALHDRDRPLPIVALTASATKGDLDRCLAVGMTDHVAKPMDARRLLAVIARHLGERESPPPERSTRARTSSLPVANLPLAAERLRGDRALLGRIAVQFADGAPDVRAKLRAAVERRDSPAVTFAAHRLRGQASSFGGDALAGATQALESAARDENWTASGAALLAVEAELERLLRALAAEAPET